MIMTDGFFITHNTKNDNFRISGNQISIGGLRFLTFAFASLSSNKYQIQLWTPNLGLLCNVISNVTVKLIFSSLAMASERYLLTSVSFARRNPDIQSRMNPSFCSPFGLFVCCRHCISVATFSSLHFRR